MFKWLGGIFKKGIKNKDFEEFLKNDFIHNGSKKTEFEWTLELLMSLEWKRYEEICREFLKITEHEKNLVELTKTGADGGIDLKIYDKKNKLIGIGQCKAYNSKITVEKIRELYGVMASEKAEKGYFFTTSTFTSDCIEFAKDKKIDLISGNQQIEIIKSLKPEKQRFLYHFATEGDYTTPTCARCDTKMVKRTAKEKGNEFWGCSNYPKCKNILQMRKTV